MSEGSIYTVRRAPADFVPQADWDSEEWRGVPEARITCFPWDENGHRPDVAARLQYTPDYVYVIFRVQDRYVRSVETRTNGRVCADACVEFFFSPAPGRCPDYFNIETNCGGVALFAVQEARGVNPRSIAPEDVAQLQVAHSMPAVVDPEVEGPLTWVNAWRIQLELLERYSSVDRPAPGVQWRANFYKCAETNSHPHYGMWSPVDWPRPDFHRPEFFGAVVFQ